MNRGRASAGFTLLEALIASLIFGLVIVLTLSLCGHAASQAEIDILQTHVENQVQDAVDEIVADLKETSPSLRTAYDFAENGWTQTALVFPTARKRVIAGDPESGSFIYTDASGQVQSQPQWQGLEVICLAPNSGGTDGGLFKYVDYAPRSYTGPVSVTAVTGSQIKLSDGTVFFRSKRDGPEGANQLRRQIQGRFLQVMTQGSNPVQLTIRAESGNERLRGAVDCCPES